jgi:hypothetical protein
LFWIRIRSNPKLFGNQNRIHNFYFGSDSHLDLESDLDLDPDLDPDPKWFFKKYILSEQNKLRFLKPVLLPTHTPTRCNLDFLPVFTPTRRTVPTLSVSTYQIRLIMADLNLNASETCKVIKMHEMVNEDVRTVAH